MNLAAPRGRARRGRRGPGHPAGDRDAGAHLEFEPIGEVRLKGFAGPTELFLSRLGED